MCVNGCCRAVMWAPLDRRAAYDRKGDGSLTDAYYLRSKADRNGNSVGPAAGVMGSILPLSLTGGCVCDESEGQLRDIANVVQRKAGGPG